jgi:septal ring factor EnvC (AmiA/AmiB activator)
MMRSALVLGCITACLSLGWGHDHARLKQQTATLSAQLAAISTERDTLAQSLLHSESGIQALQAQLEQERRTADKAFAALEEREQIMQAAYSQPAAHKEVVDDATSIAATAHIERAFERLRRP